jgi:septation ring formation regulator EzrA
MDGYELLKKYQSVQELFNVQVEINDEISNINKEMSMLPEIPENLEDWTESLADLESENFKLADFKRMFKINKKYNDLVERRELNSLKIREFVIDNLIDRIKEILK